MKEAIGEILRISPYESHLEAYIRKELADYLMTISVNYSDGKFKTSVKGADLKKLSPKRPLKFSRRCGAGGRRVSVRKLTTKLTGRATSPEVIWAKRCKELLEWGQPE